MVKIKPSYLFANLQYFHLIKETPIYQYQRVPVYLCSYYPFEYYSQPTTLRCSWQPNKRWRPCKCWSVMFVWVGFSTQLELCSPLEFNLGRLSQAILVQSLIPASGNLFPVSSKNVVPHYTKKPHTCRLSMCGIFYIRLYLVTYWWKSGASDNSCLT